jgi:hypothetical protein
MALGALRDGVVEGLDRVQGHTQLGDKSLDEERIGCNDAFIGGQWCRALDGTDALVDDVGVAHVMVVEEAFQGGATGELHGFEGGPLSQKVAEDDRVLVVKPLEDVREVVFQGTGEAIGEAHVVANEAAAMVDEWLEGTHVGALRGERFQFVAMGEPELEREFGVRRVVLGVAGRERFARPREGEWVNGKEHEAVILPQRGDEGALVEFETEGHGWLLESRAQGAHPRIDGVWLVFEDPELTCLRASGLLADVVFGLSPVDADEGRKRFYRETRQGSPPVMGENV